MGNETRTFNTNEYEFIHLRSRTEDGKRSKKSKNRIMKKSTKKRKCRKNENPKKYSLKF